MANFFNLRWLLLIPVLMAVAFLFWVFVNFARDRAKSRGGDIFFASRRRDRSGIWE